MQKETSFPQKQKPLNFTSGDFSIFCFVKFTVRCLIEYELYAGIFLDFYGVFSFLDFGGIFCFCVLNEFINF